MEPIHLANRLSYAALNDLNAQCPKTILALEPWLDHVSFWLADLSAHLRTADQLPFMLSLLSINLAGVLGCSLIDARRMLTDEMVLKQLERVVS